ncbi:MAG: hypothetical protein ACP6IY_22900, partial [Promethearchaeia archaeon]
GCPGQMQFASVRKILSKGSDGVLFLIDGSDLGNIGNALVILEETKSYFSNKIPMRIIANKSDKKDFIGAEMISNYVGEQVFEGSGKYNIGIKNAIIHLLKQIISNSDDRIQKISKSEVAY